MSRDGWFMRIIWNKGTFAFSQILVAQYEQKPLSPESESSDN